MGESQGGVRFVRGWMRGCAINVHEASVVGAGMERVIDVTSMNEGLSGPCGLLKLLN